MLGRKTKPGYRAGMLLDKVIRKELFMKIMYEQKPK